MAFKRLSEEPEKAVKVILNGEEVIAYQGDSAAAVALASSLDFTRTTPVSGAKRAPFCAMGVCFECLMTIDGQPNQRACMVSVHDGMTIDVQKGSGVLS